MQEIRRFAARIDEFASNYARDPAKLLEGHWEMNDAYIDGRWQEIYVKASGGRRVAKLPSNDPIDLTDSEWESVRRVQHPKVKVDPMSGAYLLPSGQV